MNEWEGTLVHLSARITGCIIDIVNPERYRDGSRFRTTIFRVMITQVKGKIPLLYKNCELEVGKEAILYGDEMVPDMYEIVGHKISSYRHLGVTLDDGYKINAYGVGARARPDNVIKKGRSNIICCFGVRDWLV